MINVDRNENGEGKKIIGKANGRMAGFFNFFLVLIILASAVFLCLLKFGGTEGTVANVSNFIYDYALKYVYEPTSIANAANLDISGLIVYALCVLSFYFSGRQVAKYPHCAFSNSTAFFSVIFSLAVAFLRFYGFSWLLSMIV